MSKRELDRIERQLLKINAKLIKAGLNVYLSNDTLNIMKGRSHDNRDRPLMENIVREFTMRGWDGGSW